MLKYHQTIKIYSINVINNKDMITEQQFNSSIEAVINNILKASADYNNNPEKAEEYIRRKIRDISRASIMYSEISITNELFG
jgi:hypothetical protein